MQLSPHTRDLADAVGEAASKLEYTAQNGCVIDTLVAFEKLADAMGDLAYEIVRDGARFKIPATKMAEASGVSLSLVREAARSIR